MKILMFIESLDAGGTERRLVELLKGLSQYPNIHCDIALMSTRIHYSEIFNLNVRIHYLVRKHKKDFSIFFRLYKLCKSIRPDIIHTWSPLTSVYSAPICKLLKIKLINGMVTIVPSRLKSFKYVLPCARITFPFSDRILSNSSIGLELYKAPKHKSRFIYNGFDFSRAEHLISKEIIKKKFGIHTEYVVGMVAAFDDRKDYVTYFSAAERLLSRTDGITFLAVGKGVDFEKVKSNLKHTKNGKLKFLGYQKDVESIINILDVAVLSSHSEGMPNSVLEYMALGKPVVATDVGGVKELVVDGVTGYLVPRQNAEVMCDRIGYLLENKKHAANLGNSGKQRIRSNFTLDKMSKSYVDLYNDLLSNSN